MTQSDSRHEVQLTVVLPCFNEQDSVPELVRELDAVLDALPLRSEMLFVEDGSVDNTLAVLRQLRADHPRLRIALHQRNSGESAAQSTGFRHARGELLITMDSDGQNDPVDIPRLLDALSGHDVVCGVRRRREDDWVKRLSSRIANRFRNAVTGDAIADAGCTYRALRREAVRELPVFNGMHRFLPSLLRAQGFDVVEILVEHRPRTAGQSKYGIGNRMWRGIVDCMAMRWFCKRAVFGRRFGGLDSPGGIRGVDEPPDGDPS